MPIFENFSILKYNYNFKNVKITFDQKITMIEQLGWCINALNDSSSFSSLVSFTKFAHVILAEFCVASNVLV